MTFRADHTAGGAFIAFGILVLAISGDLPVGTMSFPGSGMMPKLVSILMILFGLLIIVRAGDSPPLASLPWDDLPHAARVVAITAVAITLYQTLGFIVTLVLLLFALIAAAERRNPLHAAAYSIGVVLATWALFTYLLNIPLDQGILGF